MALLKGVVYLDKTDLDTLINTGTVEVDGKTIVYDENTIYVTPHNDDLVDSDTIKVMHENSGTTLHLSVDLLNEITRSLKIPVAKPAAIELVGFDETKSQVNIEIGEGLSLENGVLKATGVSIDLEDYVKLTDLDTKLNDYLPLTGGKLRGAISLYSEEGPMIQLNYMDSVSYNMLGFYNLADRDNPVYGYALGHSNVPLTIAGKSDRLIYNDNEIALTSDVPKFELDGTTLNITLPGA